MHKKIAQRRIVVALVREIESLTPEEVSRKFDKLLACRKAEFDAAWGIDPASPTDYSLRDLVRLRIKAPER
jgi:hypothetical protein